MFKAMSCRSYVRTNKVISLHTINISLGKKYYQELSFFSKTVFFQETFDDIITNFRTSKLCEKVTAIEVIYKIRVFWRNNIFFKIILRESNIQVECPTK
jgi:hypothetical protein